jgi:hypothetical protein
MKKSTKFIKRDIGRLRKVYPALRRVRKTKKSYTTNKSVILETATVTFDNEASKSYQFEENFTSVPVVIATATGSNSNFNVFVVNVSTTHVTLETSHIYSGDVYIQVMMIEDEE